MARQSGLGRGLGALIPGDSAGSDEDGPVFREVEIGLIEPNPHQPRVYFEEASLAELADSIKELGVLQPVLLRAAGEGRYQLVAGERRWRAARRAGLATIPAIVRATDDMSAVEQALVENLHRQDLTALEEASAYQQLIEDFGLTHDQVAGRVGKSRSAVTNTLRLLNLPPAIQQLVADGRLSAGHARALLGTDDRALQEHIARQVVQEGWSVRAVEDAVKGRTRETVELDRIEPSTSGDAPAERPSNALRPPGLLELEELLAGYLDTRVHVTMAGKRGRIAIDFADLDDLERIYRRMTEVAETTAV